jgi:hypothetical protein
MASSSYQKDKDNLGVYTPINSNGNGYSDSPNNPKSSMKKWILGGVACIVVAVIAVIIFHKPAGKSTEEAMAKADLPVAEDGSLMLFDDLSMSISGFCLDEKRILVVLTSCVFLCNDIERFLLEDYDAKSNFASFLPGVGGYFGKPGTGSLC